MAYVHHLFGGLGPNKSIKPTSTPTLRSGVAAAYARRWAQRQVNVTNGPNPTTQIP